MNIGFIKAGLKILFRRYFLSDRKIAGNAKEICQEIVKRSWNGKYYQTGLGHFSYFWIRDFGIVAESLIEMGNIAKVIKTIDWVMGNYMASGKVALCIDSQGFVFDAPKESIDALPWLIYSISISNYEINEKQKIFLEQQLGRFSDKYINENTGDIVDGVSYSELRDAVNYKKSSYSITMLFVLAKFSHKLGLKSLKHDPKIYTKILQEKYWNGQYIKSDIDNDAFSAEGSFFPFVLGALKKDDKLKSIIKYISDNKIDCPLPMRYTDSKDKFKYHWWGKFIMPNYAGSTVWTWMGALYLDILLDTSSKKFEDQFKKFSKMIEKNMNFPELLHPDGTWYKTLLYRGDEGMIWSALYLKVANKIKK